MSSLCNLHKNWNENNNLPIYLEVTASWPQPVISRSLLLPANCTEPEIAQYIAANGIANSFTFFKIYHGKFVSFAGADG